MKFKIEQVENGYFITEIAQIPAKPRQYVFETLEDLVNHIGHAFGDLKVSEYYQLTVIREK